MVLRVQKKAGLLAAAGLLVLQLTAHAQLGNGWIETYPTKRIHLDDETGLHTFTWTSYKAVGSGTPCADYSYDSASGAETFRLFDNRSNRSEIRLQNEYSSGRRQFEGYVTFDAPLDDESLFQIFGSTSGATLCMMRGYASNGGKIRVVGGIGDIQYNCYGNEYRINVIHDQDNFVQFYVNGLLKGTFRETEAVTNYWKYGCYGTLRTPAVAVRWRAVKTFRDGQPPAGTSLPPPWQDQDIGAVSASGSAYCLNDVFTVNGSGADIWSSLDEFHFVHQPVVGDFQIVARVVAVQDTNVWAKAGVMFRETLDADSAYVGVYVTPGRGVSMQYRRTAGVAATDFARASGLTAPRWVRLVRIGDVFIGSHSADGTSWVALGSVPVSIAASVKAGLALSSHSDGTINTSTFDNVSVGRASSSADDRWQLY